jgi:hypothetical protein
VRVPRSVLLGVVIALLIAAPASARTATVGWDVAAWGAAPVTIGESDYPDAASVPRILVRVSPKRPNRVVRLEWFNRSTKRWALEYRTTTRKGVARLSLNPICNSTFSYRIVVRKSGRVRGSISKPMRITFAPLPSR